VKRSCILASALALSVALAYVGTQRVEGKAAASNSTRQTAALVNDSYAKTRMAEIKADLNETYFAWSGPTTHEAGKNGSSYYRIQGPK
jgi:uncharacterized protein (UPF0333 family)